MGRKSVWIAVSCVLAAMVSAPAHAFDPVVVMTSDFEDGTAQGWFARGAATLAVTSDAAHAGTQSLRTTGRTATWNGPGRNVLGLLQKGATYVIEAYVRTVAGQPSAAVHMTMQRTPDGGSTTYERVASATVSETDWALLRGEYSFQVDSTELQLYLESTDATVAFDVDDVKATMIAPAPGGPPDEVGITTGFEGGTRQGWAPRIGSETLTVTDADAHGGQYSLLTTARTQTYAGPALNVFGRMGKGKLYTFSLWLKLAPGEAPAQLRFSIERRLNGTPSYEGLVGNRTVTADAWVQFSGSYTLAYDVDFLSLYAESASGTASFYLDDFVLTYVPPLPIQKDIPRLRDVLASDFPVGTAIDRSDTVGVNAELAQQHFGQVTPGNALKWDATEPREGQFTFAEADALVDFGTNKGMRVRGHTLVWHSQTPAWVFQDAAGNPLTNSPEHKALLLQRLENHIRAVAGRYAGRIYAWDVANEVIDEFQPDGLRRSRWFEITGIDYLRTAFRVAHEVVPDAVLYINDYNTHNPRKRDFLHQLVVSLRAEGVPVEGVGHQTHINVERPPLAQIEQSIQKFAGLGVQQEITELDISVYPNAVDSYPSIPQETITAQGYRYRDLFAMLRDNRQHLASVTLWGSNDNNTWLKNFPFPRLDLPLLFDERLQAKPAYWGVVDPSRLPLLTRAHNVPAGAPRIDGKTELEWDQLPMTAIEAAGGPGVRFQLRWHGQCLFVLVEVDDSTKDRADTVEIFVDDNNGKTPEYESDDARHRLRRGGHDVRETATGYRVEAAIPLRTVGSAGRRIGLDIRVKDTARPAEVVSWNDSVRHGQDTDTSRWGTVTLIPAVARVDARRTSVAPIIDGIADPVWARAREIATTVQVIGTGGATARARLLWDNEYLYVLARVTDASLDESSPNPYEQDSIEIFVDPDNGKTTGYDDDDTQYRISFTNRQTVGGGLAIDPTNLTSATAAVPGGYVVEARIALDTISPRDGSLLGFDLQVNDATGGRRTAASSWHDPTGAAYVNTSRWGVLRLVRF
ncbi:endo-1,4-beta-xylanase [Allorhizocola rhizosphaerae]|uniref:endo-1,4-beta-xylanase n=1 Tax=Allorhizocola rhizosphaerae TaxID=1872709 RepID=UPI000E3C0C54|nr:endo-1,4-beta-xylanase [Allorhizocola rhizosphaerae]